MGRFFDLHDKVEKKYLFNSFLVFVGLVEVLIFIGTCIWQIDEGWFGGEVQVIPFPWKEYLLMACLAPVVMIFLFGLIVRGFDLLNYSEPQAAGTKQRLWRRLCHRCALVSYIMGLLFLFAFFYGLLYPAKVIPYLQALFRAMGLWGLYISIGLLAVAMLYFPISLWLRYRLAKKAMEYQYLLTLAERHGVIIDQTTGRILPASPSDETRQTLEAPAEGAPPALPLEPPPGPSVPPTKGGLPGLPEH